MAITTNTGDTKMEIKKTVGHPKLDYHINGKTRKGYVIQTKCGEKYHAKPVNSQSFECGGVNFQSLKALKAHIIDGGFDTETPDEATEASTLDGADTWDCVHPCALLIRYVNNQWPTPEWYMDTLEAYGWLDCIGRPDIARAEREIKRVDNLKN